MRMAFAQFQEPALRPRTDQELVELGDTVAIHAAVAMTVREIALVEREVFVAAFGGQDARVDIGIAGCAAALAATGNEFGHRDAHGDARAAAMAVRAIDDVARTTESPAQRQRVQARQARIARIQDQVPRIALGPVAAGMVAGVEEAQLPDAVLL